MEAYFENSEVKSFSQNETFWKRLVETQIQDVVRLQKLTRNATTDWKTVGLELKLAEFIEDLEQTKFDLPEMIKYLEQLMAKLEPWIEKLSITKLKTRQHFTKNPFNPSARVVNFDSDECSHGSLEFLGGLSNLKQLSIKFDPGYLGYSYKRRLFQVSIEDLENIAKALSKLKKLERLEIRRSDLSEPEKVLFLTRSMKSLPTLHSIDFSNCSIGLRLSGQHFRELLKSNRAIKRLELKGNDLDEGFCKNFAVGLKDFRGRLDYFGLSWNPIFGKALTFILKASGNISHLDISNCILKTNQQTEECFDQLASMLERHQSLTEIDISGNEFKSLEMKAKFIKALEKNFEVVEARCDNCGECNFLSFDELALVFVFHRSFNFRDGRHQSLGPSQPLLQVESNAEEGNFHGRRRSRD